MHLMVGYLFGHTNAFFDIRTMPAVIPHIGFDEHRHVVSCMGHDLIQYFVEKPHAILETAAIFVVTVVCTWGDELRDEVRMSGMDLDAVKTARAGEINRLTELFNERLDLRHFECPMNGRRIEVKTEVRADRHTMTRTKMRHVAAMSELDGRFRAFGMDRVGHAPHVGDDRILDVQLSVERHTAEVHGTVSDGGHSYPASSYRDVVVLQHLRGLVVTRHILERRAADKTVTQRDRTQLIWSKKH